MKKLFIVDTDEDFQTRVKSLCPLDQVEVQLFSSGMEIFSLIAKEKPYLILISLEVPDVNDFVMYDLLKKSGDNSIPVVATYSKQSEKDLHQYKKMKFQPKEYCIKPISNDDIHRLIKTHLELDEEGDAEFSDENIDRLVRGDFLKTDGKDKDDTKDFMGDTKNDVVDDVFQSEESEVEPVDKVFQSEESEAEPVDEVFQSEESEVEIDEILKTEEPEISRADREFKNQVISLERQNEFLRSENKELSAALETLKVDLTEKLKASEELVQETEERLKMEFERKQKQLVKENQQLVEEKEKNESSLQKEIENLKQSIHKLQNDSDELKKQEITLNRTIATLTEEKADLSERVNALEETLSSQEEACDEKEKTHLAALESLNKEMEKVLHTLQFYKTRVNELGGLLQQALALTQNENLE
jgi:DNA-binding NarL/FixJ family response regulator